MNEPWFEPWMGGFIGAAFGIFGGLYGTIIGVCAPRGLAKGLCYGLHFGGLLAGVAMILTAVAALSTGQPWPIWFAFLLPGILALVILGPLTPILKIRFREAEERRMSAGDLG